MSWRKSRIDSGWCWECIALWTIAVGAFMFIIFWLIPEALRDWQ